MNWVFCFDSSVSVSVYYLTKESFYDSPKKVFSSDLIIGCPTNEESSPLSGSHSYNRKTKNSRDLIGSKGSLFETGFPRVA